MNIRTMTPEDIPQVAKIEQHTFSLPWSEKGFADALEMEDNIFLVAEQSSEASDAGKERRVAGYIGMYVSFDEGEITNVAVEEEARSHGVGKLLVSCAKIEAQRRGVCRIVLEVRVSNTPAISLYQKEGFRILGTRRDFYELPREDAYIMAWETGGAEGTRIG